MGYNRYDEEYYRPTEKVYPPTRNDPRDRNPLRLVVIILVLIIVVLAGGLITFFVIRPGSPSKPVVNSTQTNTTTQPATAQCGQYLSTGKFKTLSINNLSVNQGCVLVIDAYSGSLGGVTWNGGGVIALAGGTTYNGPLTDGEYQTVAQDQAQGFFCQKINQLNTLNEADSVNHPLDNANWPPCQ